MTEPYHLTPGASQSNAFTLHLDGKPSYFATGDEAGAQARKLGQQNAKGRKVVAAAASMLDKIVNQPVYSRAKKGPGAHHKGPRKAKP